MVYKSICQLFDLFRKLYPYVLNQLRDKISYAGGKGKLQHTLRTLVIEKLK